MSFPGFEIEKVCKAAKLQVYLADMKGQSCWETDFREPLALVVGGEAEGASKQAQKLADATVSIPMPGQAESLNAGALERSLSFLGAAS